jgi:hypothetical protein
VLWLFLATVPKALRKAMYFVSFELMNQAYYQRTDIYIKNSDTLLRVLNC